MVVPHGILNPLIIKSPIHKDLENWSGHIYMRGNRYVLSYYAFWFFKGKKNK